MGLSLVVVGVAVDLALSRRAGRVRPVVHAAVMTIRETVLVTLIIATATDHRGSLDRDPRRTHRDESVWPRHGADPDARFSLVTDLAGFGRAAAEVGAIIIVGVKIARLYPHHDDGDRAETSKGDLPLAVGLGSVLIVIVIAVNAPAWTACCAGERLAG